jgi:hypothetical protein
VDASIFIYKFAHLKASAVYELAAFLSAWAANGIDVTCVLDPPLGVRDDTKRASVKRRGERTAKKLKAFKAKARWSQIAGIALLPRSCGKRAFSECYQQLESRNCEQNTISYSINVTANRERQEFTQHPEKAVPRKHEKEHIEAAESKESKSGGTATNRT